MEIYLCIKYIHPTLTNDDFLVLDDNQWKWPYIKWYNTEIIQPTQEELETAWVEVEKIQQDAITKQEKAESIAKIATLTDQLNMLAIIMEEMVLERSTITPTMQQGLDMTNGIKAILNK